MTPITNIVRTQIIVVTFDELIFDSACYSASRAYKVAKVPANYLNPLLPFSVVKYNCYSVKLGL